MIIKNISNIESGLFEACNRVHAKIVQLCDEAWADLQKEISQLSSCYSSITIGCQSLSFVPVHFKSKDSIYGSIWELNAETLFLISLGGSNKKIRLPIEDEIHEESWKIAREGGVVSLGFGKILGRDESGLPSVYNSRVLY